MRNVARVLGSLLDRLYALAHVVACASIALLTLLIVVQVLGRVVDKVISLFGASPLGLQVTSIDDWVKFLFVAGTFLALASTLRHGVHIRVTILLDSVPAAARRALDAFGHAVGAALFAWATWHAVELALDSHRFDEVSVGTIKIPLAPWQGGMAFGLGLLALSMVHGLLDALFGNGRDVAEPATKRSDRDAGELAPSPMLQPAKD